MNWDTPVGKLAFIGPVYAKRMEKLEIRTLRDLLYHAPIRYEDYSRIKTIRQLKADESVTVIGRITQSKNLYTKSRKQIQIVNIQDDTGQIQVMWFNQPFIAKLMVADKDVALSGKIVTGDHGLTFSSPEYELVRKFKPLLHTGRLVPKYPETYGVSSKWLRSRIAPLLESQAFNEFLPVDILNRHKFLPIWKTLKHLHFPVNIIDTEMAFKRLAFEELFGLQLKVIIKRREWNQHQNIHVFDVSDSILEKFIKSLPFELTHAQIKVISEIVNDLKNPTPMNRMLQGDTGSGKTVVAALAAYITHLNGKRTLIMAPTEILAFQHFETLKKLLSPVGIKVAIQTGSKKNLEPGIQNNKTNRKNKSRKMPDSKLLNPDSYNVVVGTHALLTDTVKVPDVGLVVIDEQHRFGVRQRSLLRQKGSMPHVLTMTATPIPRSVALTVYGDLDLSVIDEMPRGRKPVKTWVVPAVKRGNAYRWIETQLIESKGSSRAFIVCPFIEPSESLSTVKAAVAEFETLRSTVFKRLRLGLLHGKMKPQEKDRELELFKQGKYDILVCTPVVEVGIDIPEASIILIEASERFGLAQLHQLRGRVGRNDRDAYCLLFTDTSTEKSNARLKFMETNHEGSKLAEYDFQMRGSGSVYGILQHGKEELKFNPVLDPGQVEKARQEALGLLKQDPDLNSFSGLKQRFLSGRIDQVSPD